VAILKAKPQVNCTLRLDKKYRRHHACGWLLNRNDLNRHYNSLPGGALKTDWVVNVMVIIISCLLSR
jgi:hypothetical protein